MVGVYSWLFACVVELKCCIIVLAKVYHYFDIYNVISFRIPFA
jgi:hypothetical protein